MYGHWSFRGVSDALRDRSFQKTHDGRFAILPALQEHVRFAELNIAEDVYPAMITSPHGMDVILCRNILFYFTPERAQRVIDHLYDSLADGGWLIVSPVEAAYVVESPFVPVQLPGGTFFYKDLQQPAVQSPATPDFRMSSVQPLEPILEPPLAPEFTYNEACQLYDDGHYAQVIDTLIPVCRSLLSSSEQHTHYEQALALLARTYANQGQLSEAQQWCEQAIRANTLNPGLQYLFATILLEQGHPEEARQSLTRALYLDPDFVLAHVALATIARQQPTGTAAREHLENAQLLLQHYPCDTIVPESEGITAGRLAEVVATMLQHDAA